MLHVLNFELGHVIEMYIYIIFSWTQIIGIVYTIYCVIIIFYLKRESVYATRRYTVHRN